MCLAETTRMSAPKIAYVCYLKNLGHEPSDMARAILNQLPSPIQRQIRCMDYFEVCEQYGDRKPAWLNGAPVLATFSESPEVFKGSAAIAQLRKIAAKVSQSGPSGPRQGHGGMAGMGARAPPPGRSGFSSGNQMEPSSASMSTPDAVPAAPLNGMGVYSAVATDELYQSVMPHKSGGGGGRTKGSKDKLAEAAAEWEAQRRGMMG